MSSNNYYLFKKAMVKYNNSSLKTNYSMNENFKHFYTFFRSSKIALNKKKMFLLPHFWKILFSVIIQTVFGKNELNSECEMQLQSRKKKKKTELSFQDIWQILFYILLKAYETT